MPHEAGVADAGSDDAQLLRAIARSHANGASAAAARRAGETALAELMRRYEGRLRAYVRRWIADPSVAEDVLQDVWLAVWRGAAAFRGDGPAAAWLFRIAHHRACDAGRRRWPQPVPDIPEHLATRLLGGAPAPSAEPEPSIVMREDVRRLAEAMRRLPTEQRATLQLVLVERLPLKEVARIMGCPEATVKTRLRRARLRLSGALKEEEP